MRTVQKVLQASLLLVLCCATSRAQVNTATIYGTVSDPAHAKIPGAQLKLENEQTGATLNTVTNSAGELTFNFVPVGRYTMTVSSGGFEDQVRRGLLLSAGGTVNLDYQLEVTGSKQSVTISAEAPLLDASTSENHQTINTLQVRDLPVAKLDWTGLLKLGNGISGGGNQGVVLNGLPPAGFNLTVDGTNASLDPELPSVGFYQGFNVINTVNTEAIQEVSTTKGIAPATVGGSMSGNINIITKGGTNQFHGSAFEFNSVSAFNARNQFAATKPRTTYNQYGGSLGGPVWKDHLFFFGDYEGVRSIRLQNLSDVVPTPEFIAQTLAVAPQYKSIFAAFPKPTAPYAAGAQTATYQAVKSAPQNDANEVGRLDWIATSQDRLSFRYTRSRPENYSLQVIEVNPRYTFGHNAAYNAQYTHSAATWSASTRFGYNRTYLNRLDEGFNVGLDQVQFGFNSVGAENYQKMGSTLTWEETVGINRGHHSIQVGGIVQRLNTGRIDLNTNGFNYASLSDFLANIPNQIQINFPLFPFHLHTFQFGGFVQDDYRVLPNLTINLGIRYDYFTVPTESENRIFIRQPGPLGPGTGPYRSPDNMYDADHTGFGPRIGFSWSLGADRKTVIRGGAGKFVNPHPIFGGPIDMVLDGVNIPFRLTLNRAQALAQGLNYPVDTNALLAQLQKTGTPVTQPTINPYFPNPYSIQWTLGVQHEFAHGVAAEVNYVGNRGLHLNMIRTSNLPDRQTGIAPAPDFGQIRYYDGSDNTKYNALQASMQKRFSHGLTMTAAYTYANNMSVGDGDLQLQTPAQDNNNLRSGYGPAPYAIRDAFNASFLYMLPFASLTGSTGRAAKLVLGGWQIAGIVTAATGSPFNITNSSSAYPADRPDVVAGVNPIFGNYTSTLQYLNRAAFSVVPIVKASGASDHPGNLGRNALRQPGAWNLDASLSKNLAITERVNLQLRGDALNAFNHTNLGGLQTNISKSNFGMLTSASARSLQLGARLIF